MRVSHYDKSYQQRLMFLQEIVTSLKCVFSNHDYTCFMNLAFQTACGLAFCGFLRCTEFICRILFIQIEIYAFLA